MVIRQELKLLIIIHKLTIAIINQPYPARDEGNDANKDKEGKDEGEVNVHTRGGYFEWQRKRGGK